MLLINKIEKVNLTSVEKVIAQYIIENKEVLNQLSTRAIAKATYTSSAAVIRLAHKLGFEGYKDLQKQFNEEQAYLNSHFEHIDANIPFNQDNNFLSIAGAMKEVMIESADDTLSLIRYDSLQQALKILQKSNHIYVFGFGAYLPLADIFKMKMSRIKKYVVVQSLVGEEKYQADMLNQDDCAIIISYSGENLDLINVASLLKENNIPIIVITSIGENSLSSYAYCLLHMSTREKLFSKIANYTTEYSVALILDILYSCYFRLDYQRNLDYKIKYAKQVEIKRFSTNKILKE